MFTNRQKTANCGLVESVLLTIAACLATVMPMCCYTLSAMHSSAQPTCVI